MAESGSTEGWCPYYTSHCALTRAASPGSPLDLFTLYQLLRAFRPDGDSVRHYTAATQVYLEQSAAHAGGLYPQIGILL